MNAGQFNKRIILQSETEGGIDEFGYPLEPIVKELKLWAMVKPVKYTEYFESKTTQSENITRFVIRYRDGVDSTMTIFYKDQIYEIESIINDNEENKTLTLMGKLVIQDG